MGPLQYAFFRDGLLVVVLAAALCGLVGVYVVLRRMSYVGHGVSHAVFGGAAFAAVCGFDYLVGAGLWGLAAAGLIGLVGRRRGLSDDVAIGVVTTASVAVGVVLFSAFGGARRNVDAVLFGDVLGARNIDVAVLCVLAVAALAFVVTQYAPLLFATFDPVVATVAGVHVRRFEMVLLAGVGLTVMATMRVSGVLLVSAMLVIPPATARLITASFPRMLWLSPAIGALAATVGMFVSYYADWPAGATVVLVDSAAFAMAFVGSGARARRSLIGLDSHG